MGAMVLLLCLWLLGCGREEPVVSGVARPSTPEEAREAREAAERRTNPGVVQETYTKAEGVYIDVPLFGGKRYSAVRGEVEAQLGALAGSEELPEGRGKQLRFERGDLYTLDDVIYRIDVPLLQPMRRDEAMRTLGFPGPAPRGYTSFTLEFRANNVWEFRRLRFMRAAPDSEDIVKVECWKKQPGDAPS